MLNQVAHTANIKISRVTRKLFLVGAEFSYICQTSHFSKGLHFLRFVRGIRRTYNRLSYRLNPSFLLSSSLPQRQVIFLTIIIHTKYLEEPTFISCGRLCCFTKFLPVHVCWMQGARNCLASGVRLFISLIDVLADIFEGKRQVNLSDRVR